MRSWVVWADVLRRVVAGRTGASRHNYRERGQYGGNQAVGFHLKILYKLDGFGETTLLLGVDRHFFDKNLIICTSG